MKRKVLKKKVKKVKKKEGVFIDKRVKGCRFCGRSDKTSQGSKKPSVDYKNIELLKRFVSEKGRIAPRRISGVCAKHQRELAKAIKRARNIALLPG
ncbi:MAG: 30S ribosomal protein S18 [Candidatus Omnitrophica bacterium]|nr:30S ribosomal protein S18 [Candidatus Omnitrophota bacterium]